ncbi:uncharacterized protein PGTG_11014 [Puccinia graminis f. sp. tritici CRL 75-36-700-3]|uniref:Uncharacterized protein n=1 Tax=Puccinia graminis f. sp. tritici (strain CRL 75-36-700-3 / race SCCL) TaxID=418459 RepID=E3KN49_PUCGT|nr:uncharacterized protein PGTG_11014 [Puccinia graminis f. sp. tritici CRL 75-36-700-3]EFP85685.2 hypothetical protein PGTG_11014 [Puccinia graminis f. sp. tritici CRL 75-36-700-3]
MAKGEIEIVPTNNKTTKKKRAPNWLPLEEEQLAISWVHVSEQPEFSNNQTGTMWTSLNTATLKFAAIYNAIERNPPSGSSPEDWMATAMTVYAGQTKGIAFGSVAAWQKVQYCPKCKAPATPTGICTPSLRDGSLISLPIGGKAAKKRRIEGYKDDEMLASGV